MPRVDDGTYKKKKSKTGFKVDRAKNYLERLKGVKGGKKKESEKEAKVQRVKAVVFDEKEREEYLLGMHKRKNERRVQAVIERRKKHRKEQSKLRKELREEARQQYNQAAKVPILPNYQFQFPEGTAGGGTDGNGGEDNFEQETLQQHDVGVDNSSTVIVSVQSLRAASAGRGKSQSLFAAGADNKTKSQNPSELANKGKSVQAQQILMNPKQLARAGSITQAILQDESLPWEVQQRLLRVKKEHRGESQPKIVVRPVRELKKIHKIAKHSRKGHGKKAKSGKKKNR